MNNIYRIPTITELSTILRTESLKGIYWSSTNYKDRKAWAMDFSTGKTITDNVSVKHNIVLVKDVPNVGIQVIDLEKQMSNIEAIKSITL